MDGLMMKVMCECGAADCPLCFPPGTTVTWTSGGKMLTVATTRTLTTASGRSVPSIKVHLPPPGPDPLLAALGGPPIARTTARGGGYRTARKRGTRRLRCRC